MSVQNFTQDELLYGTLVCRSCGEVNERFFVIKDLPFTCYVCESDEVRPQLGLDAMRVDED